MANVSGGSSFNVTFNQSPAFPFSGSIPFSEPYGANYQVSGTGADKVDLYSKLKLTFVASTPQNVDLTALTDPFGNAVNMARVRRISIKMLSTTDADVLLVGAAASNEFTGFTVAGSKIKVMSSSAGNPNGGYTILEAPNTTGAPVSGTSKVIKFDPGTSAFIAIVEITGCSV